jgi:plasmid stabilization system protein ParE
VGKSSKRYRIRIQKEAVDELDQIYRYIFKESPSHAKGFVKDLKRKILSLKMFPYRGSRAHLLEDQEDLKEVRFLEHKEYLIFYVVEEAEVTILHIAGPGQNWVDLFLGA